jgi:hypothetical protein
MKNLFLALSILSSGLAQASLRDVAERENTVNQLADAFYRYEQVRDTHVLGDGGVAKSAQKFSIGAKLWLEAWRSGSIKIRHSQGSLFDLSTEVGNFVRQQHTEYLDFKVQLDQIQSKLQSIDLILGQSKSLKGNENLDHLIARLKSLQSDLIHISKSLKQGVASEMLEMAKMLDVFNYDFFYASLKERALAQGVDSTSPQYIVTADFIKAEVLGGPISLGIEHQANRMLATMLRFETFALKVKLPIFYTDCDNAKARISKLGLSQAQVERLYSEIERSRSEVENRFNQTIKGYSDLELVETMNRNKLRSYRRQCNGSKPSVRCDIYQRLASIDSAILSQYKPETLAAVEESWQIFEESIP